MTPAVAAVLQTLEDRAQALGYRLRFDWANAQSMERSRFLHGHEPMPWRVELSCPATGFSVEAATFDEERLPALAEQALSALLTRSAK